MRCEARIVLKAPPSGGSHVSKTFSFFPPRPSRFSRRVWRRARRLGRHRPCPAGQVRLASAGRARVLLLQGLRRLAGRLHEPERQGGRGDRRQSGDDRGLQGRHPGNGKPFPDGAKMAKVHWKPAKHQYFPDTTVPGVQQDVDFMEKDSKRFADSGGWGWAVFTYDAAADTFAPGTLANQPPQGNDAKCGFACHTIVEGRDYVFTEYGTR